MGESSRDVGQSSFYGPRFSNEEYVSEGGIPTIRTTDMTDGQIVLRTPPLVNVLAKHDAYWQKGDLLVTRSRQHWCNSAFDLDIDAIYPQKRVFDSHVSLSMAEVLPEVFPGELGQKLVASTTAVGVPNVNASKMALLFPLPPLAELNPESSSASKITAPPLRRPAPAPRHPRQTTQAHLAEALIGEVTWHVDRRRSTGDGGLLGNVWNLLRDRLDRPAG